MVVVLNLESVSVICDLPFCTLVPLYLVVEAASWSDVKLSRRFFELWSP